VDSNSNFVVLLVEDSEEDVFLFRRAVVKTGRRMQCMQVSSAMDAQHYLLGEGRYGDRNVHPFPTVIFTDLNLHGLDGLTFLEWLRAQPHLRMFPCIIYSGSMNPSDVQAAYSSGVTSFVVKPASFTEWVERLEAIFKFWMDVAQAPPPYV
jgi:CheY-like chemotaxis protein